MKLADRHARWRWRRYDDLATTGAPPARKIRQTQTIRLSQRLNQALRREQTRLTKMLTSRANICAPTQADWFWHPDPGIDTIPPCGIVAVKPGTRISPDTALFHDCDRREITLLPTTPSHGASGLPSKTIEVRDFEGTYLSLATDLPHQALAGLSRHHIVALDISLNCNCPVVAYARLNLIHGPNTDHIVARLADENGTQKIEFDLACIQLDETRLNHVWLDLIFESPAQCRITLDHMALHRRPRADI